jgi:hypothetical protein
LATATKIRGWRIGIGLTFISCLLAVVYRLALSDYVYVRTLKPSPREAEPAPGPDA